MIFDKIYRAIEERSKLLGKKVWTVRDDLNEIIAYPLNQKQAEEIERVLNEAVGRCQAIRDHVELY